MKVREIMSERVASCTAETPLPEVARKMVECDCGAIPVTENQNQSKPIGIITDRDICCRSVAENKNPLEMTAGDCMTRQLATIGPEASIEECEHLMEDKQIRRVVVIDDNGTCCGMVAQADIARHAPAGEVAETVRDVSQPVGA